MSGEVAAAGEFVSRAEPYRRELLAHCYRMLGSATDAEDVVQETFLRAWRSYDAFEGRSSMRTWLYRIATNACLSALQHHSRRLMPSGLGAPSDDPGLAPAANDASVRWLQPMPDTLVIPYAADPAEVAALRDSIRLALIVSLQYLPGRQRAVLILRDVLAFPAGEVAEMLDMTTAAVKSALSRARARMSEVNAHADDVTEPTEADARALLDRYVTAFENADAAALESLLCEEAVLEAPPLRTWYASMGTCLPFMVQHVLGSPGQWHMVPTMANGEPAVAAYSRIEDGSYLAYGVVVLTVRGGAIAAISSFGDPSLVTLCGLPTTQPPSPPRT
jgi:RNA polymerase sigma-70 factor, ECF subfamily